MVVIAILLFISYSAKWCQDSISFHFENSLFKKHPEFWNPAESWGNKHEIKGSDLKKWLFKNPLVFLTDGWHLLQFVQLNTCMLAIALSLASGWLYVIVAFLIIRLIYYICKVIFYK